MCIASHKQTLSGISDGYGTHGVIPLETIMSELVVSDCATVPFGNGKTLANDWFRETSAAVPAAAAAVLLKSVRRGLALRWKLRECS